MTLAFTETGWEDYEYWMSNNPTVITRIHDLLRDIRRHPFKGIGKPEPLRGSLAGWWSRRITGEHRLVYRVEGSSPNQKAIIIQLRYHY